MLGRIRKEIPQALDLEEVFARNRRLYGSTRMEAGDGSGGGDGDKGGSDDGDKGSGGDGDKGSGGKGKPGDGSGDDDGDDGDGESEKQATALREERGKVRDATSLIAELTGKSKTEVSRALRKGGDALDALKPAADDGKGGAKGKSGDGEEVDADKIRQEERRRADEETNARLVRSEVRALAAETFANPRDAVNNLELDDYEVDDNGDLVDADKVKADLAALLKKYPHYARKKTPAADRTQGRAGGTGERPNTIRELARMRVED